MTQEDLAKLWGIRMQTVSAWERGQRPQRRFRAQIAEFLDLRNEEGVEALLSGRPPTRRVSAADGGDVPPEPTRLQALVIEAVAHQLKLPGSPKPEVMDVLVRLMASVGLPGGSAPGGGSVGDGDHDNDE